MAPKFSGSSVKFKGHTGQKNKQIVNRVKFVVSRHFLENAWKELPEICFRNLSNLGFPCIFLSMHDRNREWPEICNAHISWPPSELISFWSWSVDFRNWRFVSTSWLHCYLAGHRLRDAAAMRSLDLLVIRWAHKLFLNMILWDLKKHI